MYSSGTNYPFVVLLSTANQGTFKLIAGADSYCASDTCRFVVTVATSAPACGMAANSFKPGSSPAVTTPHTTSTNYSYYYKAIWSFSPGNVTMYFGDRPGQSGLGVYKVKYTTNYTSLADNECAILYTNQSASYAGASGYIFTSYSHSTSEFTVSFCDLAATSSTPGNLNLSGNMQTHY